MLYLRSRPVGALVLAVTLTLAGLHSHASTAPGGVTEGSPAPRNLQWITCPDIPL